MTTDVIDVSGLSEADIQQVRELVVQLRTRPSVPAPLPPLMVQPGTVFGTLSRTDIYDDEDADRNDVESPPRYVLTDAQREELHRRIADAEANPDDYVLWTDVLAESRRKYGDADPRP